MIVQFRFRRGTATEWTTANPILESGEPGYESTSGRIKVGDGVNNWINLPYQSYDPGDLTTVLGQVNAAATQAAQASATANAAAQAAQAAAGSFTAPSDTVIAGLINSSTSAVNAALVAKYASKSHTHPASAISGLDAAVDGIVAAFLRAGANVTIDYTPGGTILTINSTGGGGGGGGSTSAYPGSSTYPGSTLYPAAA